MSDLKDKVLVKLNKALDKELDIDTVIEIAKLVPLLDQEPHMCKCGDKGVKADVK